ncbi:hypothetical protein V8F33_004245 [Rhypophila sp. PSN 637]
MDSALNTNEVAALRRYKICVLMPVLLFAAFLANSLPEGAWSCAVSREAYRVFLVLTKQLGYQEIFLSLKTIWK